MASANANAASGIANATANVSAGIGQFATGFTASANLVNSGTLTIGAVANATGTVANAHGKANLGVLQVANANGGGNATLAFNNSGNYSALVSANAIGNSANASAFDGAAVFQSAHANATTAVNPTTGGGTTMVITPGGNASAALTNSGKITVGAVAKGTAHSGGANVAAVVSSAIVQSVGAADGSASAAITNSGSIVIAATADANAASFAGTGTMHVGAYPGGTAHALAWVKGTDGGGLPRGSQRRNERFGQCHQQRNDPASGGCQSGWGKRRRCDRIRSRRPRPERRGNERSGFGSIQQPCSGNSANGGSNGSGSRHLLRACKGQCDGRKRLGARARHRNGCRSAGLGQ